MKLYTVARWDDRFTCSQSKKLRRLPSWFPCPNRLDEPEIVLARTHSKTSDLIAAWHLMLRIASQSKGAIAQPDGTPHDAASLGAFTGCPAEWFQTALPFYTGIRALTVFETSQQELPMGPIDTSTTGAPTAVLQHSHSSPTTLPHRERETERQKQPGETQTAKDNLELLRETRRRLKG
jgi:hypothetical protein